MKPYTKNIVSIVARSDLCPFLTLTAIAAPQKNPMIYVMNVISVIWPGLAGLMTRIAPFVVNPVK